MGGRWGEGSLGEVYDHDTFQVANGQVDFDVKLNRANLFKNILKAGKVTIQFDQNISFKFNNTNMPAVEVYSVEQYLELADKLSVSNIFITNNSGQTANIRVWSFL